MSIEERRRFIGFSLAAAAVGVLSGEAAARTNPIDKIGNSATTSRKAMPTYLVIYKRGPRWAHGVPMKEQQGMGEHFKRYVELYRAGQLREAGGFADESGGAALFEASDDTAAAAFVAADPAVVSGTFVYELKQWRLNPWGQISGKPATRGE